MFGSPYYARQGIFSALKSKINFNSILNTTQKTLNIANQAIPLINQVKPLVNNTKTLFKIMGAVKDDDTTTNRNSIRTNNSNNNNNTKNISNTLDTTQSNVNSDVIPITKYSATSQPVFFI